MTEQYQQNNINVNPRGARVVTAASIGASGDIELDFDDELVIVDTAGAAPPFPEVQLPSATQIPGFTLTITSTDPTLPGVVILPVAGETIGGAASISLTEANQIVVLKAGTAATANWEIVASGTSNAGSASGLTAAGTALATGGPLDATPQGTVSLTGLRFDAATIATLGDIVVTTPALGEVTGDATSFNINAAGVYQITFNLGGNPASSILAGAIVKEDSGTLPVIAIAPEAGFQPTVVDILNIGVNRNPAAAGDSLSISTTLVVSDSGTAPATFSAPVGVAVAFICTSLVNGFTPTDSLTKVTIVRIADA